MPTSKAFPAKVDTVLWVVNAITQRIGKARGAAILGAAVLGFSGASSVAQSLEPSLLASLADKARGGISITVHLAALEEAARAGDPMSLWQLGLMYESGRGVAADRAKALKLFEQIADQHADAPPQDIEADIVANSFIKLAEYYRSGLPEAGIKPDEQRSMRLYLHAATYFGDADAQFKVGEYYLDGRLPDRGVLMSARWLSLAARKGHAGAQARLGSILFNGDGHLEARPIEGLMWLTIASQRARGTGDEGWIEELHAAAIANATPEQRGRAEVMVGSVIAQLATNEQRHDVS